MPITLNDKAEKVLVARPDLRDEVAAYAIYLAQVKGERSSQTQEILKDAASMALNDTRTWHERTNAIDEVLDEIGNQLPGVENGS